jgi:cytochrome c oxidase assembly protein subunit 15
MSLTASDRTAGTLSGKRDPITNWLLMVAGLTYLMVVIGGYVRLSRAGLSIVEWDVFGGILPPIGDAAWQETFALYQQTPEYQLVNAGMSMGEYQRIFYIEWGHRLIARLVGLIVVIPLVWFMWKGLLRPKESLRYWGIAALFGLQGLLGWLMVSSGLEDRPLVNEFRLTIHLLTALALLGIVLWMAWNRMGPEGRSDGPPAGRRVTRLLLMAVVVQIAYGGLVAGLRAGYVSDTWPLMFGRLVPRDVWGDLLGTVGSHWFHRWFAFVVAGLTVWLFFLVRRHRPAGGLLAATALWLLIAVGLQIALGVAVVWLGVPKWFALAHQGLGVVVFVLALRAMHRLGGAEGAESVRPHSARAST